MRTSDGMPMSSTVRRSASRIWAALRIRIRTRTQRASTDTEDIPPIGAACLPPCPLSSSVSLLYSLPMPATVNVNGRVFDQEHAVISVFDHGFLYGEGVYETLRTYNGQPFLFERHMRRLRTSADMLALGVPLTNAEIEARLRDTMRTAGLGD